MSIWTDDSIRDIQYGKNGKNEKSECRPNSVAIGVYWVSVFFKISVTSHIYFHSFRLGFAPYPSKQCGLKLSLAAW